MEVELRYSIGIPEGSVPGDEKFVCWGGSEDIENLSVHGVEKLGDGTVCIDLGASMRPCSIILNLDVLEAIEEASA